MDECGEGNKLSINDKKETPERVSCSSQDETSKSPPASRPSAIIQPTSVTDVTWTEESVSVEFTLRRLTVAAAKLLSYERNDLFMKANRVGSEISSAIMWINWLEHFRQSLPPALAYVKLLPAFTVLSKNDRCLLFSRAVAPLIISQLSLSRNSSCSFFGYNDNNRRVFLELFPQFKPLDEAIREVCQVISAWQPTTSEFAILQAHLFYQDSIDGIEHPQFENLVETLNRRLKIVLNTILKSGSPLDCDNRLRYFVRTSDLICNLHSVLVACSKEVYNHYNYLDHDRLYREVCGLKQSAGNDPLPVEQRFVVLKTLLDDAPLFEEV